MAKFTLSTLVFDPDGFVELDTVDESASDFSGCSRRVTRTATLDGGAVIYDAGYSPADRTVLLTLGAMTLPAVIENLQRIVKTYTKVYLCLPDGIFLSCPQVIRTTNGKTSITLLIEQAMTEYY